MRQIPSSNGVRESSNPIPGEANKQIQTIDLTDT